MDIAVIGGTGAEGFGISRCAWRPPGTTSRSARATPAAVPRPREPRPSRTRSSVRGRRHRRHGQRGCRRRSVDVVLVTVPFAGQADIYRSIKGAVRPGAVVLDATSPLATAVGGRPWQIIRPWHGSAAEQARAILGDGVRLVSGFHTIAAKALAGPAAPDRLRRPAVRRRRRGEDHDRSLVDDIPGLRWVDCGDLSMARITETLTALLIDVNRRYKVHDSGFRVIGREAWGRP